MLALLSTVLPDDGPVLDGEAVRAIHVHPAVQRRAVEQVDPIRVDAAGSSALAGVRRPSADAATRTR